MVREQDTIRVSKTSPVKYLAASIVKEVNKNGTAYIRVIGAGSLNQLVKAFIVAKGMVSTHREPLSIDFYFEDITIDGKEVTAIKCKVK